MVNLILGRTGTGKTEYCFNKINELSKTGEKDMIFLTPEQNSFVIERRIHKAYDDVGYNVVKNLTFRYLCHDIDRLYGSDGKERLTSSGKALLMNKSIGKVSEKLKVFNKKTNSVDYIESAISIYDEMKSCRISTEDISNVASSEMLSELLSQKLEDIATIIDSFDSTIGDKYVDPSNELEYLYERLLDLNYFNDKYVFIDGFTGFVAQEYKILEIIFKQAKSVYITLCTDVNDIDHMKDDSNSIFSYVNKNISIIKDVAKDCNVKLGKTTYLKYNHRFENCDALLQLESHFFDNSCTSTNYKDHVRLYQATDVINECDWVSSNIIKLLRTGVRAKDISVICRNNELYENEIISSFNKFGVPYFNDDREEIHTQPLILFVLYLLRICVYGFKSEDVFSLIKTGLTSFDQNEILKLENYCYIWNINGIKSWENDFIMPINGVVKSTTKSEDKQLEELNILRQEIFNKLIRFKLNCKNKSCKKICEYIYYVLKDFNADEQLKLLAKNLEKNGKSALAEEQGRIWDVLMDILNQIAITYDEKVVSISEFYNLFNIAVKSEDLGSIPVGLDNVQFGSAERIRCNNPYAVFIVGANEGEFPLNSNMHGFLSDHDRDFLIENDFGKDFKLYSYSEILIAQEKYFSYMALCAPTEKLYISYRNSESSDNPSELVDYAIECFYQINIETKNNNIDIDSFECKQQAFETYANNINKNNVLINTLNNYFSNLEEFKSKYNALNRIINSNDYCISKHDNSEQLFGKEMYLSASRIDNYYHCPFQYYLQYGLSLKKREQVSFDALKTGLVVHYVLEQLLREYSSDEFKEFDEMTIRSEVSKLLVKYQLEEISQFDGMSSRFKYQLLRLNNLITSVACRVCEEYRSSDFINNSVELKIGKNEDVVSKPHVVNNNLSVTINGSIDRVDVYDDNNGKQYVKVVDYKTGPKDLKYGALFEGLNLQMFIYLYELCHSKSSYIPAAVLYQPSDNNYEKSNKPLSNEEYLKVKSSHYQSKGVFLYDDVYSSMPDHLDVLENKKFISFNRKKDGNLDSKTYEKVLSSEDFNLINTFVDKKISQMATNLNNGIIQQNPYESTCDFCDFKIVCNNSKEISKREEITMDKDTFINSINGDNNE